jgi:pimeloyl-ACP methyl ester carboxylesterase
MKQAVCISALLLLFFCTVHATFVPVFKGSAGGLLGVDAIASQEVPPSTITYLPRNKNLALREFVVYLPPGYFDNADAVFAGAHEAQLITGCGRTYIRRQCFDDTDQRCAQKLQAEFPVVYFLDGDRVTHLANLTQEFVNRMDLLISSGTITPMVLVSLASDTTNVWGPCGAFQTCPPNENPFMDGKYMNSSLTGFFESYITNELYQYIQSHYRVSLQRAFTGIFGYSQGGYGAMLYAAKHSDLYGMVGVGAGLIDYTQRFIPGFAAQVMLYSAMGLITKLTPSAGNSFTRDTLFSIFCNAAARSPQYEVPAPGNPGYEYGVALPFDLHRNIFPQVVTAWSIDALDTVITQNAAALINANMKIFLFNGVTDTNVPYVDARRMFDVLTTNGVPSIFITHEGNHFVVYDPIGLPLYPASESLFGKVPIPPLVPTLQYFSALMLTDPVIATKKSYLTGVGTIQLQNNAVMSIGGDAIVAVETDVPNGVTTTDITIQVQDSAQFDIGVSQGAGGAMQVGDVAATAGATVEFTLEVNGPGAQMIIGPRGFFGFGAGLNGKGIFDASDLSDPCKSLSLQRQLRPSNWVVTSLYDVINVTLSITQGAWRHQQILSSNCTDASLLVFGQAINYDFSTSNAASIFGGGNMMLLINSPGMLANVTNLVESPFSFDTNSLLLYLFGVNTINTPISSIEPPLHTDPFGYGFPFSLVQDSAPTNTFQRQLLTSTPLLLDPDLTAVTVNGPATEIFEALGVSQYKNQVNYQCVAAQNLELGRNVVGYVNSSNVLTDYVLTDTYLSRIGSAHDRFLTEIVRSNAKFVQVPDCLRPVIEQEIKNSVQNYGALTIRIDQDSPNLDLQYNGPILP